MARKSDWSLEEQLLGGRTIEPNTECWLWRTCDGRGYGKLTYNYKTIDVHRVAAHLYLGLSLEPSDRKSNLALHKCSNKHCFNPEHLYIGSQSNNIVDAVNNKTHPESRKTHCPKGHPYDLENTVVCFIKGKQRRHCRTCRRLTDKLAYTKRRKN